jgi:hypothetical protein
MTSLKYYQALFNVPFLIVLTALSVPLVQAENRIDTQLPNAPELSAYGDHKVGVKTLDLVNPNQIDVVSLVAQTIKS